MNHPSPKERLLALDAERQEAIVNRAIEAWLDKKFAQFGKWTASGLVAFLFAVICKYAFTHGWWN